MFSRHLNFQFSGVDIVPGHWTANDALSCSTPAHRPGQVSLALSLNGEDFTPPTTARSGSGSVGRLQFTFESNLRVVSVNPASGPLRGGTLVTVTGVGFTNTSALECRFSGSSVSLVGPGSSSIAVFVDAEHVTRRDH